MTDPRPLVDTAWLAAHLDAPDLKILDATGFLPNDSRTGPAEFRKCRIPGAVYFDVNEIADTKSGLSHTMPSSSVFLSRVSRLGVGDGLKVVVYDVHGGANAAMRAWWMFRFFGHDDVAVLDGGLPKWLAEGRPTEDGEPAPIGPNDYRHFTPWPSDLAVKTADETWEAVQDKSAVLIDARSAERFAGTAPEPRPSLHQGHVPGARNLPFARVFNPDKTVKSPAEIRALFAAAKIPLDGTPLIGMCGTGVTGCVAAFAAYVAGEPGVALYDGSWEEWGNAEDRPFAAGPAD